jgi:hypothetical protein
MKESEFKSDALRFVDEQRGGLETMRKIGDELSKTAVGLEK